MKCATCGKELNIWNKAFGEGICVDCSREARSKSWNGFIQSGQAADPIALVHGLGVIFIVIGLLCAIYFAFIYDTSVTAHSEGIDIPGYGRVGAIDTRVHNLGLLQNRQTGVSGGMALSILGGVLLLYQGRKA